MAHGVGKRRFFSPENFIRQIIPFFKSVTEEIFTLSVFVHLHFRVNRHNIFHEINIAERNSCLQRVYGNTTVGTENVIHMKFTDSFLGLFLELLRRGGKIRIFVAENFVGDFTRQKNSDIRLFVNCLTYKVHTHTCSDCCDIVRTQKSDYAFKTLQNFVGGHIYFFMVASDIIRNLFCIFKVNGVLAHTDGKGFDGFLDFFRRNGAHKG